ncbi:SPT7_3 [Sanghuangporus weigelae]
MEPVDGEVGDKRNLAVNGDVQPRSLDALVDPVDLWWEASTSSTLVANALPTLTYPSSATIELLPPSPPSPPKPRRKKKKKRSQVPTPSTVSISTKISPRPHQQHHPNSPTRETDTRQLVLSFNSEDSSSNNGAY